MLRQLVLRRLEEIGEKGLTTMQFGGRWRITYDRLNDYKFGLI